MRDQSNDISVSPGSSKLTTGLSPRPVKQVGLLAVISAVIYAIAFATPLSAQGSWKSKAPLPTARYALAAVEGPGGLIYTMGGTTCFYCPTNTVEVYSPSTNTWTTGAPLPTPRYALAAASLAGLIYAIGGYNVGYGGPLATVEAFSQSTNTWSTKASMTTVRLGLAVVVANGRIYAIGGDAGGGGAPLSSAEMYDPATN
jgi:N-acetylneuraminic acid mutarotase